MQAIRLYDMPDCKMASSGVGMFGEEKFERFMAWFSSQPRSLFPKDFLFFEDGNPEKKGLCWLYLCEPGLNVPQEFEIIDFPGGLYAVATDVDQKTDMNALNAAVDQFLAENGLERDPSRKDLGNIITSPRAQAVLGYEQMDYYAPVRERT